jgi:transposase
VVQAYEDGAGTFKEVAERFSVGEASVNRWVSLKRRTGSLKPAALGGQRRPGKFTDEGLQFLRDTLDALPGSTLQELCEAYDEEFGIRVHVSTMHEWVRKRLGMTRKRGSASRRNEIGKTSSWLEKLSA